ncbi:uncharacterized protein LOC101850562 [Aplysia californica]|uniref:Uncharacterized protein LOC101850562 n=1 Tax=Aplysia californica TaxID=6500 RepID=A0ABM0JNY7_APLCA|nr:uncharacterized protein LOC101850562 [Aplysia californica]
MEVSDYYGCYKKYMGTWSQKVLNKDLVRANKKIIMDFYINSHLDTWQLGEEAFKAQTTVGGLLKNQLDDPWKTLDDLSAVSSYLKRTSALFRTPDFPPSSTVCGHVARMLRDLFANMGQLGYAEELYSDMFDFAISVNQSQFPNSDDLISAFENVLAFFRKLKKEHFPKNCDIFPDAAKRFKEALEVLDMKYLTHPAFASVVVNNLLEPAFKDQKKYSRQWVELVPALLKRPCEDTFIACDTVMRHDKSFKWKEYPEVASEVFDLIAKFFQDKSRSAQWADTDLKMIIRLTKQFLEGLRKSKMLKEYGEKMLFFAIHLVEINRDLLFELSVVVSEKLDVDVKKNKAAVMAAIQRYLEIVKSEDLPWDENRNLLDALKNIVQSVTEPVKDAKTFSVDEIGVFVSVAAICLQHDPLDPHTGGFASTHYLIFNKIMGNISGWLEALNRFDLAAELIPDIVKTFDSQDEAVDMLSSRYLMDFSRQSSGAEAVGPYLGNLIEVYKRNDGSNSMYVMTIAGAIESIYPANPKGFKSYYQEMFTDLIESANQIVVTWLARLFWKVSKTQPELFSEEDLEKLLSKAREDQSNQPILLQMIQELCKRRPSAMIKHIDKIFDESGWQPVLLCWMNDMISTLALHDQSVADKSLTYLLQSAMAHQDKANLLTSLNAIRLIGFKYPDTLKLRRSEVEGLSCVDADGKSIQTTILDMIDGKTPSDLAHQLESQLQEVSGLALRVEDTEEAVTEVHTQLDRQGADLDKVKNDVTEQGQRLDHVEETVDETVAKVEVIDQKTLSHAPYWSRDVSKLLNPESEHDWRLLGSRLGYSNDDIRSWAQQADPCMAMFNEWYATRKTSEATFAILTQLQEMDRMDAAIVVENAMKNAEAVVEDEDFEYASPPPIFISYQWGHQEEVKLLKQHLEMAGYECWLDIGQMGGGDKLFEKIDNGIRAAKVVISCVTEKYAKSPNCNREVNLSVGLNKSLIPLLMEKCVWPPPGSMGPIFSEFLYIRFYQQPGEELDDQRYWPGDKFQELLMQLSTFGLTPDEGKIQPVYRNWWMPKVEEIKIDKSKTRDGGNGSQKQQEEFDKQAAETPDVFISYQWGKQPNIIKLYERLTSLGFTCWLDIKQMGGGDSLYDKIDRGLRGSRVVLSCVTQKYSLSANCRREVSLADALKKPLVPLLLEKMTWPPAGPMSMVMTQLLYIDFSQDDAEESTWTGPKFRELEAKIREHVKGAPSDFSGGSSSSDQVNDQVAAIVTTHPKGSRTSTSSKSSVKMTTFEVSFPDSGSSSKAANSNEGSQKNTGSENTSESSLDSSHSRAQVKTKAVLELGKPVRKKSSLQSPNPDSGAVDSSNDLSIDTVPSAKSRSAANETNPEEKRRRISTMKDPLQETLANPQPKPSPQTGDGGQGGKPSKTKAAAVGKRTSKACVLM